MRRNEKAKLIFKFLTLMIFFVGEGRSQKLFLVAGQSNASGAGDFLTSQRCNPLTAFEYRESIKGIIPLADPVGEDNYGFDAAKTGSARPAFAKRYYELSSQQVYIVPAAKSGSSLNPAHLEHLRRDSLGNLWKRCVEKTQNAIDLTNIPLSGIIWAQGEADASFINSNLLSKDKYFIELKKLIYDFGIHSDQQFHFI
jgi:hypothetical protein